LTRKIKAEIITRKISEQIENICCELPLDVKEGLSSALKNESDTGAKKIISQIIDNYNTGEQEHIPLCQDTGLMTIFVSIGNEIEIEGRTLTEAINEGVKAGYLNLRKSVVRDPLFERENTNDNTPAVIHINIIPGSDLEIYLMAKGGGAENASATAMLSPASGVQGIKEFVLNIINKNAVNACPPIIVGIGIGGNFEQAPYLAKKALLRNLTDSNSDIRYAKLEQDLFLEINKTGVGPAGLGGITTALAVKIEQAPCHIASLPVAVNIQCHSSRHKKITI